jgi:hemolysin activation/secretion protein
MKIPKLSLPGSHSTKPLIVSNKDKFFLFACSHNVCFLALAFLLSPFLDSGITQATTPISEVKSGTGSSEILLLPDTLKTNDFIEGRISSGNIDSGNIDSVNIDSVNIDSVNIDSGNINSGNIDSGNINSGNIDSGNIDSGNINSEKTSPGTKTPLSTTFSKSKIIPQKDSVVAQTPPFPAPPPSSAPKPPEQLPPPDQLLTPSPATPPKQEEIPAGVPTKIKRFVVEGSTVFSQKEMDKVLQEYLDKKELSFGELLQARSAITKLYVDNGYITSAAIIPPQRVTNGIVKIQVVEGGLEGINVSGLRRLNPGYVRSRLALATKKPLNVPRLLDALRVLQLDPLIQNLSAELSAGSRSGSNVLDVTVREADTFSGQITLDNGRSPSVGSFRRRAQISQANLLGLGDGLVVGYTNTDGSNGVDASYTLPINARNGTLNFSYGTTSSNVIERPFSRLDIISDSRYYEITFRQPLVQTPSEEFALGVIASRRESETSLLDRPFRLAPGADEQGSTRISSVRFFQEWTKRSSDQVLAARSQFNVGIGVLDATINQDAPDSRFFSWRGQAQWVRRLAPDTLFLIRGDMQLADRDLVPTEQFGLGGLGSVRGYRQDFLLTDNGLLLSAEVRVPIYKASQTLLSLIPFVDFGTVWNSGDKENPPKTTLTSVGLGLQLSLGDTLTARIDWGIPLVSVDTKELTWQENGIYFTITANPF